MKQASGMQLQPSSKNIASAPPPKKNDWQDFVDFQTSEKEL